MARISAHLGSPPPSAREAVHLQGGCRKVRSARCTRTPPCMNGNKGAAERATDLLIIPAPVPANQILSHKPGARVGEPPPAAQCGTGKPKEVKLHTWAPAKRAPSTKSLVSVSSQQGTWCARYHAIHEPWHHTRVNQPSPAHLCPLPNWCRHPPALPVASPPSRTVLACIHANEHGGAKTSGFKPLTLTLKS